MRAILILALVCAPAQAGAPCNVGHVQNVVVKKQVVATHAVNYGGYGAVVLNQVTPYAYYSVGQSVQEEALAERISRLVAKKLEAKAMLKNPQPESPLGLTVLQKCVGCHRPDSKSVVTSGAPALFDAQGNLTATPMQLGSMLTAARNGLMPPPPAEPLDDDSFLALKQYLSASSK